MKCEDIGYFKLPKYFEEIIDIEVSFLSENIKEFNSTLDKEYKKISDAKSKISELESDKKYQTESEQNQTDSNINKLNSLINSSNSTIENTTKSIKEVELKNMKPEDNVTVSRYIERNVGSIINKDYVIEGFLGMGKLSDCKDEMVSRLDISKRYCLEILVAFLQEADIIILHEMFENVWNHAIEEILVEFSLRGAVVVFSEHGEESLMKLPMHSYDLSGRCVGW